MLKFIKHSMLEMDSVEVYPMIALLLFGGFFLGWLAYSIMMPKSDSDRFSQLPLEPNDFKDTHHE
mgnify:CR=1 FL=1|jgi:hypothetical protein